MDDQDRRPRILETCRERSPPHRLPRHRCLILGSSGRVFREGPRISWAVVGSVGTVSGRRDSALKERRAATTVAWLVTRSLTRALCYVASSQMCRYSSDQRRVRTVSTSGSSSPQVRDTADFDTPARPSAFLNCLAFPTSEAA